MIQCFNHQATSLASSHQPGSWTCSLTDSYLVLLHSQTMLLSSMEDTMVMKMCPLTAMREKSQENVKSSTEQEQQHMRPYYSC